MIALLRSELLRFRSRRLVKTLAVIGAIGMLMIAVVAAVQSNPSNPLAMSGAHEFIEGTSALVVIAGWVIGTSLIGAEWQAGTMTTLLTWEPRRFRVFVAKTIAAAVGVFVLVLLLELAFTGMLWLVAATRGTTAGFDGAVVSSILELDLRVALLAAIGSVLGLSLATVTRNTGAALGIAFVYLAIVEGILRGWHQGWRAWLLGDSSSIFLLAQHDTEVSRTLWSAGAVLLVWCVAFATVAMTSFRVRDVN